MYLGCGFCRFAVHACPILARPLPFHLDPQVYSTNLEIVGRMAPLVVTVSSKIVAPIASFLNSSKVIFHGSSPRKVV